MKLKETLAHYRTLRERVTEKFSEIQAQQRAAFVCTNGCHSCCKPHLTVSPIEATAVGDYLKKSSITFQPYGPSRCAFLERSGACSIYSVRPLVCRSHGAPLQFFDGKAKTHFRDVCPLNFTDRDIATLAPEQIINLDTLNTLLATLNIQAFDRKTALARIPLTPEAIQSFFEVSGSFDASPP